MKRALIICILLLFIFGLLWTEGYGLIERKGVGSTPEEALFNSWASGKVTEIIAKEKIDSKTKLLFYRNLQETYMVALIEKKWNNNWEFIQQAGEAWIDENQDIAPRSSYLGMKLPIYWGLIGNEDIVSVEVSDKYMEKSEASILSINELAFFYIVAPEPQKGWGGADLTAYDKYENIIASEYF